MLKSKLDSKIFSALAVFAIFSSTWHTSALAAMPNSPPIVEAGADQTVTSGATVNLLSSASDPEGGKLTYVWSQPLGNYPKVTLTSTTTLNSSFVAPTTDKALRIKLVFAAKDPQKAKAYDVISIFVNPVTPPVVESTTKINDTGVTTCGDYARGHSGVSNNDVVCGLLTDSQNDPVPLGQDGTSGRDITSPSNEDGVKGFSFTKISSSGGTLANSATQWSCVKDNVTGLIWEVKTDDGGLHDKDDTFVWYETDPRLGNGGLPGFERATDYDPTRSDQTCSGFSNGSSSTYCNTKAFVNRVNSASYCGANNWRLPTREELHSLVAYESMPRIDTAYFPLIQTNYYWTSVSYAYLNKHVWTINFQYGGASPWEKYYSYPVMLVHN